MSLKDQLVKLGSTHKELRPHIRPLLAALPKRASRMIHDFEASARGAAALGEELAKMVVDAMPYHAEVSYPKDSIRLPDDDFVQMRGMYDTTGPRNTTTNDDWYMYVDVMVERQGESQQHLLGRVDAQDGPDLRSMAKAIVRLINKKLGKRGSNQAKRLASNIAHVKVYDRGEFIGDQFEVEEVLERHGYFPEAFNDGSDLILVFRGQDAYQRAADAVGKLARKFHVSKAFRGGY